MDFPVQPWTSPDEELLHERDGPISFRYIVVSTVQPDCRDGDFCLKQEEIDNWCSEYRPDQANSIWCRDSPPMRFSFRTDAQMESIDHPTYKDEPDLAARFSDTPLGRGWVKCYYHPDTSRTDQQGEQCWLRFNLAEGFKVSLSPRRAQITSGDPSLMATIALIPEYWTALTDVR
ncbi:MAG: hypothetical protein GKR99_15110 [Rhodobacteraceae bacterium]|nr:hypothetical protein [Paracoccaceae bacterium]